MTRKLHATLFSLAGLIILAHVALAYFSFPQADTFHVIKQVRDFGIMHFAANAYITWSGRWLPYLLVGAAATPGIFPDYLNWIVTVNFFLFLAALGLVLQKLFTRNEGAIRLLPLLDIAVILLALPLSIKKESFFWSDTNIMYVTPLWLFFVLCLLAQKQNRTPLVTFFIQLLAFLSASFCEQFGLLFIAMLTGIFYYYRRIRLPVSPILKVIFPPIAAGFLFVALSPGTFARLAWYGDYVPGTRDIGRMGLDTAIDTLAYLGCFIGVMLAYGIIRAAIFRQGLNISLPIKPSLWWLPAALLCVIISVYPAVYNYKATHNIGGRIFFIAAIVMIFVCLAVGEHVYCVLKKNPSRLLIITLIAIVSMACIEGLKDLSTAWQVAGAQKQSIMHQLAEIKNAAAKGQSSVTLPNTYFPDNMLVYKHMSNSASNEDYWINRAIADYYGLKSVSVK